MFPSLRYFFHRKKLYFLPTMILIFSSCNSDSSTTQTVFYPPPPEPPQKPPELTTDLQSDQNLLTRAALSMGSQKNVLRFQIDAEKSEDHLKELNLKLEDLDDLAISENSTCQKENGILRSGQTCFFDFSFKQGQLFSEKKSHQTTVVTGSMTYGNEQIFTSQEVNFSLNIFDDFYFLPSHLHGYEGLMTNDTNAIFIHNGIIYLGTNTGLAVSKDQGQFWETHTTLTGLAGNQVLDVFVGQENGGENKIHIYVATNNGLSFSIDGGQTWETPVSLKGKMIYGVHALFSQANIEPQKTIFVATHEGFWIDSDGKNQWKNYRTTDGLTTDNINDVFGEYEYALVDPEDPDSPLAISKIHVALATAKGFLHGIFYSEDCSDGITCLDRWIADSSNAEIDFYSLYAAEEGCGSLRKPRLFAATSRGVLVGSHCIGWGIGNNYWQQKDLPEDSGRINDVYFLGNLRNSFTGYAATENGLYTYSDQQEEWVAIPNFKGRSIAGLHIQEIIDGDTIFSIATSQNGLWISSDNLETWTSYQASSDVPISNTIRGFVSVSQDDETWLYGATPLGVVLSEDFGTTWRTQLLDIGINDVYILGVPPQHTLYAATNQGLYITKNQGLNWEISLANEKFTSVFAFEDQNIGRIISAGTLSSGLFMLEGSNSPRQITTKDGLASNHVQDVFVLKDSSLILAATDLGLSVYQNGAWQTFLPGISIKSVFALQKKEGIFIYAGIEKDPEFLQNGLIILNSTGEILNTFLEDSGTIFAIQAQQNDSENTMTLYVATEKGFYQSLDSGETWSIFLTGNSILSFSLDLAGQSLYVGTQYSGVAVLDL